MEESTIELSWISNPAAYGAIGLYAKLPARKLKYIGGVNELSVIKGYFLSKEIYVGDDVKAAMAAVEAEFNALPEHVRRAIAEPNERYP